MASLEPRPPYTDAELDALYPQALQLQQVQVILRHGERSPVSLRFENAGLTPYWPYCHAARRLTAAVMTARDGAAWSALEFERRLEAIGRDDAPVVAAGPGGEMDGICIPGEITDKGRATTLALGQRLRALYVDRLRFLPASISSTADIYLRCTPLPRALESLQQTFCGLYPADTRAAGMPRPVILTRHAAEENLFDNTHNCARYGELSRAFAARAAARWNDSADMRYLNKVLGRWMPAASPRVAVDGRPRLSGVMDTVNATLAHGAATRLPDEFYDARAREVIDRVAVEEWFQGYKESAEFRRLGMGALVADVTTRMVRNVEQRRDGAVEALRSGGGGAVEAAGGAADKDAGVQGDAYIRLGISGAHDTTIAGFLASVGAFDDEPWPPYTSHIAIELFERRRSADGDASPASTSAASTTSTSTEPVAPPPAPAPAQTTSPQPKSWLSAFASLFTPSSSPRPAQPSQYKNHQSSLPSTSIARTPTPTLSSQQKKTLQNHYVRIRYNDRPVRIPGCASPGAHLEGDATFCTLAAFKAVADAIAPRDWRRECGERLGEAAFGAVERAGFPAVEDGGAEDGGVDGKDGVV